MKVLLINPNSDVNMTRSMEKLIETYQPDGIGIDVVGLSDSPEFIYSKETIDQTYEPLLKKIKEEEDNYDIFIISCHLDPNLEKIRQKTKKLVIGIGQASVLMAQALGLRFSIIGSSDKTVGLKTQMVEDYGGSDMLDYVGYPDENARGELKGRLLLAGEDAINRYDSSAIILGCAGYVGIDSYIEEHLGVHVIDGLLAAIGLAEFYHKYKAYKTN